MPRWFVALAVGALVFYTDDYVIAGVIPELARDLGVTAASAGQLVTVFSVTVALAAPIAAVITARLRRRTVLTAAASAFVVANCLAAVATSLEVLLALRVLAGLAAASTTPALFSTTAQLAPPDKIGRYVAVVAFGVTGAIALGVPLGTWIGGLWGWRATFAAMALAGAATAIGFASQLPRRASHEEPPSPRAQLRILARPAISLGLTANTVLMLGSIMLMTYLAPVAQELVAASTASRGALFALSGAAGMVGIWVGGLATDRWGTDRTLLIGVGAFILAMATLVALWPLRPVPVVLMVPISVVWGGAAFWNSPAAQARLHHLAGPASAQALALNTSGTYLGVAAGGAVGGAAITVAGLGSLPVLAGLAGLAALGLFGFAASWAAKGASANQPAGAPTAPPEG